jgi:hypothetical protein
LANPDIEESVRIARMAQSGENLKHRVFVDRIIYATITIMSTLIVYDGWQTLKLIDVAGVIVGPVLAMFLVHVFSAAMAKHVEAGRILTGKEWTHVVASEAPFLLLCVPPLVIVTVLFALGVSLTDSIQVTVWFGTATLGYWGYVAGRRAGFAGWRLIMVVALGLLIGVVILLIQVLLQPGKAFSGGVALG